MWFASGEAVADVTMCNESLQLQGEEAAVGELRSKLASGMLQSVAGPACDQARVHVRSNGKTWLLSLVLGDERVEREVNSMADAAVWVESWLLPLVVSTGGGDENPASTPPAAVEAAPAPAKVEPSAHTTKLDVVVVHPGATVVASAAGLLSDDGTVWTGGELAAEILVSDRMWLGAAVGGALDTELSGPMSGQGDVRRGFVHATARAGSVVPLFGQTKLRAGGGLGVGSAWVVEVFEDDDVDKGRGGLLLESVALVSSPLGKGVSLSSGLVLRGHVVRFGTGGLDPDEESLPEPLPVWHAELQVGVAFALGGGM
jgi:hypothetical protein